MQRRLLALGGPFLLTTAAFAQLVVPGSHPHAAGTLNIFLGPGARAEAMGGAFTAVADDPTAAAWNPAGLAQLSRPELSVSYDRFNVALDQEEVAVAGTTASGLALTQTLQAESSGDYSHIGFAAFTLPINRLTTQISYRKLSTFPELDTRIQGRRRLTDLQANIIDVPYSSQAALIPAGDIYDYAFSLAGNAGRLSLGISVNYLVSDAEVHFTFVEEGLSVRTVNRYEFSGWYADLGALFRLSDRVSAGGVIHTGFDSDQARWPSGFSAGVAWRPFKPMILAADYSSTGWSESNLFFPAGRRDEQSIRLGAEYSILLAGELRIPLRAGLFRIERPGSLYGQGGTAPEHDGWSVGGGMAFDRIRIDLGYSHGSGLEESGAGLAPLFISAPAAGGSELQVAVPARSVEVSTERLLFSLSVVF